MINSIFFFLHVEIVYIYLILIFCYCPFRRHQNQLWYLLASAHNRTFIALSSQPLPHQLVFREVQPLPWFQFSQHPHRRCRLWASCPLEQQSYQQQTAIFRVCRALLWCLHLMLRRWVVVVVRACVCVRKITWVAVITLKMWSRFLQQFALEEQEITTFLHHRHSVWWYGVAEKNCTFHHMVERKKGKTCKLGVWKSHMSKTTVSPEVDNLKTVEELSL